MYNRLLFGLFCTLNIHNRNVITSRYHSILGISIVASISKSKRSDSESRSNLDQMSHQPHDLLRYSKTLSPWTAYNLNSIVPAYRVLSPCGKLIRDDHGSDTLVIEIISDQEKCLKIYRSMLTMHHMDHILYNYQRQGRISFYMTGFGEEASVIASAAALQDQDSIFAQYRELGALVYRGFTLTSIMNQLLGNMHDPGKGRQMPIHYGSKDLNYFTISSPLATQIPQASGAAYAIKSHNEQCLKSGTGNPCVIACYFGEGAASEGDFHAGLNFASTLNCPVIFICRNNGYAISTPIRDQYVGDGIASRGPGYGIHHTYRVDGNDVFAVYNAVKRGRQYAINNNVPVLIEAMTYRVGHHSTSDDSSAYRKTEEVNTWIEKGDPIDRFRKFIQRNGWWDESKESAFTKDIQSQIKEAFHTASKIKKPHLEELFNDVYDELPWHLNEQKQELFRLLEEYPDSPLYAHTHEHHRD